MNKRALFTLSAATATLTLSGCLAYFASTASHAAQTATTAKTAATTPALLPSTGSPAVVEAANAFLATLSAQQRTTVQAQQTAQVAGRWSNFPVSFVPRNGIFFRDLNPAQVTAAMKVARLALGEEGFKRFQEIRAADDVLGKADSGRGGPGGQGGPGGFGGPPPGGDGGPGGFGGGPPPGDFGGPGGPGGQGGPGGGFGGPGRGPGGGNEYSANNYIIAFLGKPSKTEPWILQFGGHHLAFNLSYKGASGAATPYFIGTEPTSWKDASGKTHEPMAPMHSAMYGLVNSLTPEQQTRAKLSVRFNDVYVGPGRDGHFPARSEGVLYSELSPESQKFVKQAIAAWSGDNAQAAQYQKLYNAELNQTKVAYSGTTTLNNRGDYVRIDGPHVWIEFSSQGGIVFRNQIHYHTIWRDRVTDYGAEFSY